MVIFKPHFRVLSVSSFVAGRRRMSSSSPYLLSPRQVVEITKSDSVHVAILDSTWFMPNSPRNAKQEFHAKRIPGSQFLDLDAVASDDELGLKHMMPDNQTFACACEKLGISPSSHVILYDSQGVFSSPRALFMFRTFGHNASSIIDGGLPLWSDEGLPLDESSPRDAIPTTYAIPNLNDKAIRSYEQMVSNSQIDLSSTKAELVLDARSKGRYLGTDPEPRPGLSSGHIPHSISLAFNLFLKKHKTRDGKEFTTFLAPSEIRRALDSAVGTAEAEKIINGTRPVVTSCGSGMTAGILWLGLQLLGVKQASLYDESWTGYAMRLSSRIAKS